LLLGFVRCFFSSTRPRSDRNNRSTTPSSSSFLLLFLLLLRDILATTSFLATFNLFSPYSSSLFAGKKYAKKRRPTESFSRRRPFLSSRLFRLRTTTRKTQRKEDKRRRNDDDDDEIDDAVIKVATRAFLLLLFSLVFFSLSLSLSLSRGLLFPEVVMYTRGQNKTKNNGI